jgi:Mycoplasma protein of unknown function, DUF285
MFENAQVFDANLSQWEVGRIKSMSYVFNYAQSFSGIGIEYWNISRVLSMEGMFQNATNFDANLSLWYVSTVQDMYYVFNSATSFHGIGLEYWKTSHALSMQGMFQNSHVLDSNLSLWTVSNVKDMSMMFSMAKSFRGIGLEY